MPKPRASVRGLGARLQAEAATAVAEHPIDAVALEGRQVVNLPLEAITPNPSQPRKHFGEEALRDLADSILSRGLLQPIIVKRLDEARYLLVAGERRFRACRMAGMKKIPALVTDGDELEIAIIENLQREDLKPLEESEALKALADRFRYTQERLATVVGKSRVSVTESLSLLDLPDPIKVECRTSDIGSKHQLLQVVREQDPEKQLSLWEAIKGGKLTVRDARRQRKEEDRRGRPSHFTKSFTMDEPAATVTVRFRKPSATQEEVLAAMRLALKEQEKQVRAGGSKRP